MLQILSQNRKWLAIICTTDLLPFNLKYRSLSLKQPLWPELEVLQRKTIFGVLEKLVHENNLDATLALNTDKN